MARTFVLLLLLLLLGWRRVGLLFDCLPIGIGLEGFLDRSEEIEKCGGDGGFEELRSKLDMDMSKNNAVIRTGTNLQCLPCSRLASS